MKPKQKMFAQVIRQVLSQPDSTLISRASMLPAVPALLGLSLAGQPACALDLFLPPQKPNPFYGIDAGREVTPALVDIDSDADLDVFTGDYDGRIKYYENIGDSATPVFEQRAGAANPLNSVYVFSRSAPFFADLDDDGDSDFIAGSGAGNLNYYENSGDAFNPVFEARSGTANPFDGIDVGTRGTPALLDFDHDGDFDLFIGEYSGNINYYENTGDANNPAFQVRTGTNNPFDGIDVGTLSAPFIADFDNDGEWEALAGEANGSIRYFVDANGVFEEWVASSRFTEIDAVVYSKPVMGDIDNDGTLDLFVGNRDGDIRYYQDVDLPQVVEGTQLSIVNPLAGIDVGHDSAPVLADIDNDGDLDVFAGVGYPGSIRMSDSNIHDNGKVKFLKNIGTPDSPVFQEQSGMDNPLDAVYAPDHAVPALVDIDADGDLDAFIGNDGGIGGMVQYYENTGDANTPDFVRRSGAANPLNNITVSDYGAAPAFADMDNDGDWDVFLGEKYGTLNFYENIGTVDVPAFAERTGPDNPLERIDLGENSIPFLVDLDRDGDMDAFIGIGGFSSDVGKVKYYENIGTARRPVFLERAGSSNPLAKVDVWSNSALALGDIDNDGDLDALFGNSGGRLYYYKNVGPVVTSEFVERTGADNPFDGIDINGDTVPFFVDIDKDGDFDLFAGEKEGHILYYENTAAGFMQRTGAENPLGSVDVGNNSTPAFVDIDHDGDQDVFIGKMSSINPITFLKNTGTARTPLFEAMSEPENPLGFAVTETYSAPIFVDIDDDGDYDAFIGESISYGSYELMRYYENTGTRFAPDFQERFGAQNPLDAVDASQSIPRFSDFDRNGNYDAVIAESTGLILYYENTGNAVVPEFQERFSIFNYPNDMRVAETLTASGSSPIHVLVSGETEHYYDVLEISDSRGVSLDPPKTFSGGFHDSFSVNDAEIYIYFNPDYYVSSDGFTVTVSDTPISKPVINPIGGIHVGREPAPIFVDIDNDGDQDIFLGNDDGNILFYENTSSTHALPRSGVYDFPPQVQLRCTDCSDIYYTLDGATPTVASTPYTGPLNIAQNTFLKYIVVDAQGNPGEVFTENYTVDTKAPAVTVNTPEDRTNFDDITTIQGTAGDSGLDLIELQITDGSMYLDPAGNLVSTPAWVTPTGLENWSFDISTVTFPKGTYTITARATDKAGNIGTGSLITVYSGDRVFSTLNVFVNTHRILQGDPLSVAGQIKRHPAKDTAGVWIDLREESVGILISNENNPNVFSGTALTDDLGNYYFDIPNDILTEKGTHTVAIDFTGSGTLHAAQTVTENVLVGNSAGYAILLQGKTNDEEGMASYDKSLTRIYDALLRRQFIKDDIRYFNYDHPRPDTSGVPAKQAIRDTLTAWACDRISGTPAPLYLVMMDHGNPEAFYLGDETITPEELNTWFEELESCLTSPAALEEPRVTIIGACYSGSFIPDLSGDGRTIISSSTAFEVSYKGIKEADDIRGGEFFVDELFVQLERGLSLRDAFEYAVAMTEIFTRSGQVNASTANPFQDDAMQHPLMDDNHDGAGSNILRNSDDGDKAAELYLGAGTDFVNSLGGSADIERITPAGFLRANQSSTPLWLEAYDASQVAVAIVEIRPPSKILYARENTGQIDIELDNRLLLPVPDSNRFELPYTDFAESGRYEILYKVVDRDTGAVSPVWRSLVYKDKLDNMPPYPFTLSVPANDAETRTVLGLSWENNGDPDNDPVSYTLEIANDFNFNEIVHSQQEVTSALTYVDDNAGLEDGSRYYWRVIATDFYGASTPSRIRTFNTNNPSDSFRCIDVNTYDGVYSNPVECPTLNFDPPLLTQATALTDCQAGRTLLCGEFDRSAIITEHPDYQPVTSPFDTQPGQITPINVQLLPSCPPTCASPGTLEFSLDNKLSVTEGNERIIYVSRDNGTDTDISVAYTVGGTAVAGNDYEIAGSNMLTWPDTDARNKPIRIATIDDDRYEKNETITLELSNSFGGAEIGAYFKITVTVEDNDPPVFGQLQFPETLLTVTESQDSAAISVERIGGTDGPVSVEYMIVNGSTAAQDQDYQLSGILNFASGQSTAELTLSLLPDLIPEGEELLGIQLINPTGGAELGDNQQLIVTIQDDDPPPTISFSQSAYQLNENDGVASITLRRDSAHGTATLDYSTRDQTARAGSHYMAVQGSVFFGESETEKTIHIKIYKVTGDKNFVLQLARSDNAVLEANEVEIIIKDNPPPPPRDPVRPGVLAFSASILNIAESQKNIRIPIMRTLGADGSVSVEYRILSSGSTATEGEDFQLNDPQRIAFQAGQSMAEVNVTILDDQRFEAEETLALELVTPEGGAKLGNLSRMTLTIADDDTNTIQWELPDVRVREDSGNIQVAVTRTLAQGIATAYYKTQDGSARAGTDYIAAEGVVFFASGKMQASVSITVLDNQAADGMKTFSVLLSDPEGAVLGNTDSTDIAIFDNEGGTIQFSAPGYSARQEQGVVAVTLIRAEAAGAAAWVDYQTQDGSAQAGTDFIAAKDIAFFPEGKTEANIFIHLLPNPASSGLKTFTLHLSNPVGVDLDEFGSTEISITNEVLPKGSIHFTETHYSVIEEGQGVVNLEREGGTAGEVCVTFSTGLSNHPDAPASLEDFIPIEQQNVCWADGENGIKTVKVKTSADQLEENDELVELRITAANPEALGSPRRATLIIKDPTARKDILYFLQIAYSVAEANAVLEIPVLRSGAGLNAVEVEYATVSLDGVIAERDRDYRHQNGSLRWEKGDIEKKIIRLEILDDNVWEEDEETLYILLSDPANGASLQNASKVKIIIAADQYPNLGNGVVAFGAAGTTAGFFGGSSIGEAEYQAVLLLPGPEHSGAKKLSILAKLTPDSEHHGVTADILAVVGYTHSFALEDECWTEAIAMNVRMVTAAPEGLTFPCWDSNPDTLQPYKNNVLLESSHIIKLYDGPLPPGLQAYQVYFGYRLADGTVIFNGEQTIHASTLP